jgi:hypothetical protein
MKPFYIYRLLLIAVLFVASLSVCASSKYPLSLGIAGGYSNCSYPSGEIYLKFDFDYILNRKLEMKVGINNHTYLLDLNYVSGIEIRSFSLFSDITVFPFNNGIFTGIRCQLINTASLPESSEIKISNTGNYDNIDIRVGMGLYFQGGYQYRISDKFNVRLLGQPGIQHVKVHRMFPSTSLPLENHYLFIFDVMLGFEMRF